ncbi:MAG TPA: hypothetical protein DCG54_01010 [Anaerolineae bacterium]|jgi:hypothetical protein|nr:hypothetical protein [Anaerolineae bacterium]
MTFTFNQLIIAFTAGLILGSILVLILQNSASSRAKDLPNKVIRERRPSFPIHIEMIDKESPKIILPVKPPFKPIIDNADKIKRFSHIASPDFDSLHPNKTPRIILDPELIKKLRTKR